MSVFLLLVVTILLSVNAVVCATWGHFLGIPGWWIWQWGPAALAMLFVGTTIAGYRIAHPVLRGLYTLSAVWLGFLNYLFFAAVLCWVAAGIAAAAGIAVPRGLIGWSGLALGVGAGCFAWWKGSRVEITRLEVALSRLPAAWHGRKAAVLSDLHLGQLRRQPFLRKVLNQVQYLQPDVVFISGDLYDGSPVEAEQLLQPWKDYSVPLGVWFVTGNHDEFTDREYLLQIIRAAGIRVLDNEGVDVQGLQILGIHDREAVHPGSLQTLLRRLAPRPDGPTLLLAHQPAHPVIVADAGVDLQISGHTHGGQFWPWNLAVARIYRTVAHGLNRQGTLQVLTSRGTGTWGPPFRLGTVSEIVELTFLSAPDPVSNGSGAVRSQVPGKS